MRCVNLYCRADYAIEPEVSTIQLVHDLCPRCACAFTLGVRSTCRIMAVGIVVVILIGVLFLALRS